jgi:tetratricopeptide (TPR) repeat protein
MAKPFEVIEQAVPDPESIHPTTATEYVRRAWLFYANHNYEKSIDDFYRALDSDPENVDTVFGLGLALKADGKKEKAVETFEKTLTMMSTLEDHIRAQMLKRLTIGHINQIKTGDWNLEKELWHTKN